MIYIDDVLTELTFDRGGDGEGDIVILADLLHHKIIDVVAFTLRSHWLKCCPKRVRYLRLTKLGLNLGLWRRL